MSPSDVNRIMARLNDIAEFVGEARNELGTHKGQINELFKRQGLVERNGCGKAGTHKDHEDRLRMLEHDDGRRPLQGASEQGVSLGKWFKVSGYRMQDVILLLFALLIAGLVWTNLKGKQDIEKLAQSISRIGQVNP